jgi:hypothetical protein
VLRSGFLRIGFIRKWFAIGLSCMAVFSLYQLFTSRSSHTINQTVYLDQRWDAHRAKSYSLSQGSRIFPYAWYFALEQADNTVLLSDEKTTTMLRYLSAEKSELNPDGLPIGFVKDTNRVGDEALGITCAACHTTKLHYQGTALLIDGGPTMGDYIAMVTLFHKSLVATLNHPDKFSRFAHTLNVPADKSV